MSLSFAKRLRAGGAWPLLIGAVVLAGLALRVLKAWTGQFSPNSDYGIVSLMAKHMAEGRDFPVFFYGQPYMGSLEPGVSALLCRLFGASPFVVCLGTALVGSLLLPLVYLWGREAGGRRAGLMALLFCVVGSDTNLHYAVAPRGGYMTMMVGGVLTLWLAARIVTLLGQGRRAPIGLYLGMGLAAGLGWWSNQLMIVFLMAAAVLLLTGFRWRLVRDGLLPAAAAFAAGSAPWWFWNATHGWATFDFGGSLGKVPLDKGTHALAGQFLELVELSSLESVWNDIRLGLLAAALVLFGVLLVRDRWRREHSDRFFFRLAAVFLLVLVAAVCATSHYILFDAASRYLLPMFPALAVMVGVGAAWLLDTWRLPVGWAVLLLLIPKHVYELPRMREDLTSDRPLWQKAAKLADAVGPLCDNVCIGPYYRHWMNFATGERLCVACLPEERYAPYARRAELAERPAFLDDYRGLRSFLAYTQGKSLQTSVDEIQVDYAVTPPTDDWRYVDPAAITGARDHTGASCGETLTDGVLDTSWSASLENRDPACLVLELDRPRPLSGVRFVSPNETRSARNIEIEGQLPGDSRWQSLLPPTRSRGYFWSGPYVRLEGVQMFQEYRFAAPTGGVGRVRLTFRMGDSGPHVIRLAEVLLLEEAPAPAGSLPSPGECLTALRLKGAKQFLGPRWMAERVAVEAGNTIRVHAPSLIARSIQDLPGRDPSHPPEVLVEEATGLLMDTRDAVRSRQVLQACGLRWEESTMGKCVLLVVAGPSSRNDFWTSFFWTEQGCFAPGLWRFAKRSAESLYRQSEAPGTAGDAVRARALLEKALTVYPHHQPARRSLVQLLNSAGLRQEAEDQARALAAQTVPGMAADIHFPNGVEFFGLTLPASNAVPGKTVDITYYLKCPASVDAHALALFVHFEQGKGGFVGDHVLLEGILPDDVNYQPFPEIFSYTRRVQVPASALPGDYRIVIGLFNRSNNRRLVPTTDLKETRRAVELPAVLKVLPAQQ